MAGELPPPCKQSSRSEPLPLPAGNRGHGGGGGTASGGGDRAVTGQPYKSHHDSREGPAQYCGHHEGNGGTVAGDGGDGEGDDGAGSGGGNSHALQPPQYSG